MISVVCADGFEIDRHLEAELACETSWTCRFAAKLARSAKRSGRPDIDEDDVRQELLSHIWLKRGCYDGSRASYETFARGILRKKKQELCRRQKAEKRGGSRLRHSIHRTVHAGTRMFPPAELLAHGGDLAGQRELKMDVHAIAGTLSADQVRYCHAKLAGVTDKELASEPGYSVRLVHWLKHSVAEHFAAQGFSE